MTVFSIAAYEKRHVVVVDIGGAYLNADMDTGVIVYMRLDGTMSKMTMKLNPDYGQFTDNKGCIIVRLDKALYGCVEFSALWYENLSNTLGDLGYIKNEYEACVYNRNMEGVQSSVAVNVDDLIITSVDLSMINDLCAGLKTKYGEITRNDGPALNYLGMEFDLSGPGEVHMNMKGYANDTILYAGIPGKARSPATDGLFVTRDCTEPVPETVRAWFHSVVAKLS